MQHTPRFNPWLTALMGLLVVVALAYSLYPAFTATGPEGLRFVGESAGRKVDRHMYFYGGYEGVASWERTMHKVLFGDRASVEAASIGILEGVLDWYAEHPERRYPWNEQAIRARLMITLAETGRHEALGGLLAATGDEPEEEVLAATIAYAYAIEGEPLTPFELRYGSRLVPGGWAHDRLRLRLAERTGDAELSTRFQSIVESRGAELRARLRWLAGAVALALVAGLWVLWRARVLTRATPWGRGILDTPWGLGEGLAVMVRAAFFGVLIALALGLLHQHYFRPGIMSLWSTLIVALPLFWLMHRHLLGPRGLGFPGAFGLSLRGVGARTFLSITLALLALEWAGGILIAAAGWALGLQSHWSKGMHELSIFGGWQETLLHAIDAVVWVPLVEEVAFRGLLYVTLRAVLRPWPAILLSALLFAALHVFSVLGFLTVLWGGIVLAWSFERFRSLLPGMVIHAAGNLLSLSTLLLFYR
jgi:uncharacterized protein